MADIIYINRGYINRGIKYEERKKELTDKIRKSEIIPDIIDSEKDLTEFTCYFCENKIENEAREFNDNGFHFALDSKCYAKARGIYLVKNN